MTLHSYHFYVEQGLPKTKVLLWVYGEQLRAMFENVVLAEYHCRYDWQDRKVKDVRDGVFYATQFASSGRAFAFKSSGISGALSSQPLHASGSITFSSRAIMAV